MPYFAVRIRHEIYINIYMSDQSISTADHWKKMINTRNCIYLCKLVENFKICFPKLTFTSMTFWCDKFLIIAHLTCGPLVVSDGHFFCKYPQTLSLILSSFPDASKHFRRQNKHLPAHLVILRILWLIKADQVALKIDDVLLRNIRFIESTMP